MDYEAIMAKMEKFFAETTPQEIMAMLAARGYEFEDIDNDE